MLKNRALFWLVALSFSSMFLGNSAWVWASPPCNNGQEVHIWTAPRSLQPGHTLGIMAVATDGALTGLRVTEPDGHQIELPAGKDGGPPWSLHGTLTALVQGNYKIEALQGDQVAACREVNVGRGAIQPDSAEWDLSTQAFYAAWVEQLFDAPAEETLSFPSLEPVLRDPERNFLYDYLEPGEDLQVRAEPDCADLSYFLHAYFAWKLGLPMAIRPCSRGSANTPPRCDAPIFDTIFTSGTASVADFRQASVRLMDTAHSGSGRTALNDSETDFYPVALERSALWPGTVFADPYGHTLIIVKWIPQTGEQSGMLLAVDAQPDNSVARKRFWEGNFLFAKTPSSGPGFKAYRVPLPVNSAKGLRQLSNAELTNVPGLPPYSNEQANMTPDDFYARMGRLINPQGLDPEASYSATLEALMEQLETRVRSVANGEEYMRSHPGTVVPMPTGGAIFETTGPWEDYSTPSRDMRLLIAIKVLDALPERIRHHPELFILQGKSTEEAAADIERLNTKRSQERFITYTRSDGSPWQLTLAEIYKRCTAFEVAYNPNDCVERRWGASPDTAEFKTCQRQAPADQRKKMQEYRSWFRETRRPPR